MSVDLNRIRRYERKYLVNPEQAAVVREFVRGFMEPDLHTEPDLGGYTVNNLYLDTPDLYFYHEVKLRRLRRFKPRMRYYGADTSGGLWLEVKNKYGEIVWKNRHRVSDKLWPEVLQPRPATDASAVLLAGPTTFEDMVGLFPVEPVMHVRYFREAWVSAIDPYGRVTFDTRLRCRPAHGSTRLVSPENELAFFDDPVTTDAGDSMILVEVKTETQVPWWALEIARRAELWQRGFSKYCYGVDRFLARPDSQGRAARR